jgi:hypothetical protein
MQNAFESQSHDLQTRTTLVLAMLLLLLLAQYVMLVLLLVLLLVILPEADDEEDNDGKAWYEWLLLLVLGTGIYVFGTMRLPHLVLQDSQMVTPQLRQWWRVDDDDDDEFCRLDDGGVQIWQCKLVDIFGGA